MVRIQFLANYEHLIKGNANKLSTIQSLIIFLIKAQ